MKGKTELLTFDEWQKTNCSCGHYDCGLCSGTQKTSLEDAFMAGQNSLKVETQGLPDIVFIKVNQDQSLGRAYTVNQINLNAKWPPGVKYVQYELSKDSGV